MHTHIVTTTNDSPDPTNVPPDVGELTKIGFSVHYFGPNPDVMLCQEQEGQRLKISHPPL